MTIYSSPYEDFDEKLTLDNYGLFIRKAWEKNSGTRFTDGASGISYAGSELAALSKTLVNSLYEIGLRAGDVMSVCCKNTIRTPLVLSAVWSLNAVGSGLDFGFRVDEYEELAAVYEPKAFMCIKENLALALELRESLKCIKWIIVLDEDECDESSVESKVFSFGHLISMKAPDAPKIDVDPDALAYMPRTSGTTGRSKLVMHAHKSLISAVLMQSAPDVLPFDNDAIVLSSSSLHHAYNLFDIFGSCSYRGFNYVHAQSNDVETIMRTIERFQVNTFFTTPYIVLSILNLFKTGREDFVRSSLRSMSALAVASNVFPEDSVNDLRQCLPDLKSFGNLYGQTEILATFSCSLKGFYKPCTIGRILSRGKFRVVDPKTLEDVPQGEKGELIVQVYGRKCGYYKDPEANKLLYVQDNWLRTGDIVTVDDEGFVTHVGRLKEFIKTKYTTISPGEVEAKIMRHPLVKEVAVIGLPHPILQAALHAIIVPFSLELDDEAVNKYMSEIAPDIYKLEGGMTFCDAIPRSAMGKLVRKDLLQWVMKRNECAQQC